VVLELNHVDISVGVGPKRRLVWNGFSLDVRGAERLAVRSADPVARRILIEVAAGLLTPDRGEVHTLGHPFHEMDENARAEARATAIGLLHPALPLIAALSIAENLEIALFIAGFPPNLVRSRVGEVLEAVGMTPCAGHLPGRCSPEERVRARVARAFVHRPPLFLADGVTAPPVPELIGRLLGERRVAAVVTLDGADAPPWVDRIVTAGEG
jgi:putative ABC transport system ATP-binding protein